VALIAGLVLVAVFLFPAQPVRALEELEAEESISDFLPQVYPLPERETVRTRRWAILPEFGYAPDTGPLVGAKYAHRDVYRGTTLDFEGTYALNQQRLLAFSVGSPHLLDDRLLVLLRARYYLDPQREFFGLGNNDYRQDPDLPSTHEFQELAGGLTVGWRPFERLAFNLAIGLRRVDIGRGKRKDNMPFTQEQEEFRDLPGINGGLVNRLELSLVWNNRDDVMRPTRGWRVILKVSHTNKAVLSDFEFTRYVVDMGYLYSFFDRRLIAGIRANGGYIDGPAREIPFWELEEIGGQDTMRGFFPHRFLGKERVLLNGELRLLLTEFDFFKLWHVKLDGVVFGDGGRVFLDHAEIRHEFSLNSEIFNRVLSDFRYSYGAGVRIALSNALVARIDVGFSNEETGLVYLSFGQTF
jgi:outer membrane protein assembly factor BamA